MYGKNMSKKTIFDYLNNICVDKVPITEDDKGYSPFMINRFVSMSNIFIPIVNEINKYQIPKEIHFNYMASVLPKRKQFFKYMKKKKEDKNFDNNILCLCRYNEIGRKEAENYLNVLSKEQIEEIADMYKTH